MKNKFLIVLILIIVQPFISFSQDENTLTLSLKEAQEYAVTKNLNLENVRLDIDKAQKRVWETTSIGLPQVNGNLSYQHIPGDLPTASFSDSSTAELYSYIFGSLEQIDDAFTQVTLDPLPTLEAGEPFTLGVKNSTTYTVTVSQLIFSGEYIIGLQAAKAYLQISKLNYEKQEIELKGNVLNNYISILILEDNLTTIKSSIINMESLVNETNLLSQAGFLESTDADQLQITLNTLINAKNTIERQIGIAYTLFKIVLGADLNENLVLTDDLNSVNELIVEKAISENFELDNNIDYKMMTNQVKLNELLYKREQAKYLPTISAFYNYQDKTNKASFDFTINHIIGVNLDLPIFTSFQRKAVAQQAKIEYSQSVNNQSMVEQNLTAIVQELRYNYYNTLEKYNISNQNVELSKKVFNNTSKKYKEGMASSMDLTQSNNTYLQAETDKINALYELIQIKIELEKLLNEI
ncbi:TolC family protein [Bacteroidota bacterium]